MKKALIAMSGGVDSSVAAFLMKKDGYSCIGATMKLYDNGVGTMATSNGAMAVGQIMPFSSKFCSIAEATTRVTPIP